MAVTLRSLVTTHADAITALAELGDKLVTCDIEPDMAFVFYDAAHDDALIDAFLHERLPGVPVIGGTSGGGLLSDGGLGAPHSIGLLLISDPDGLYGVASHRFDGRDPADIAEDVLRAALDAADAPGELPEIIWLYQAPGQEEGVLAGLRRVVGSRCPVVGGSAGDDGMSGHWRQLGPAGPMTNGVVVAVLFPSGGAAVAYQGGYEPSTDSGLVTALGPSEGAASHPDSARHILTIDEERAADVLNRWLGGVIPSEILDAGGTILQYTLNHPLGFSGGASGSMTTFRLVQPATITPEGGITTFAGVPLGARAHMMRGSKEGLIRRAGRVTSAAANELHGDGSEVAGGIAVYCAGCRLAVGDDIDRVVTSFEESFDEQPFLGCFTGGEQGTILDEAVHANLMISAVVLGR